MTEFPFGEWLKRQRKANGWTQEQLADKVGCSAIAIRKFEAEERRPSTQIVERLAHIFQIPAKEQAAFLRFARGDWSSSPEIKTASPWSQTGKRSNLPASLSSFIGREQQIADLTAYLQNPETRFVTLIGPPGIGKTRLSLETARRTLEHFADGAYFAPLAPLTDPRLIPTAILQALNFVEAKDQPPMQQLVDGIGSRRLLLVLDNCEHLIEDVAPLTSGLLSACSSLTILATSRESLRIPGEWLYNVPTLEMPEKTTSPDVAANAQFPAIKLFTERARAVRADFQLTAENLGAVIAICQQLDGLPLAIELIATRIRLMSPQALLDRLNESFTLSADGMRAVPARQKTLFNAIGWTYHSLPQDEQKLFQYLSVFSGGFLLHTAEAMFSQFFEASNITDFVMSLADKSMLQRSADTNGDVRFSMLATIQQFASSQLKASGDETKARDAHLKWFVEFSTKENAEIRGPGQVESARRVERELDNFRTALGWSVASQKTESALMLLSNVGWHWELQAHYREAHDWLVRIRSLPDVKQYPLLISRILSHIGRYLWSQDTFEEARGLLEEGRSLAAQLGKDGETYLAEILNWLGLLVAYQDQNFEQAQSLFSSGLELFTRNEDEWGAALSTFHLGILESSLSNAGETRSLVEKGRASKTRSLLEKSLVMFQELGDLFFISRVSLFLGYHHLNAEEFVKAREYFDQHLKIDSELQFWDGIAEGWRDIGFIYQKQGDEQMAEDCFMKCRQICSEHGLLKEVP